MEGKQLRFGVGTRIENREESLVSPYNPNYDPENDFSRYDVMLGEEGALVSPERFYQLLSTVDTISSVEIVKYVCESKMFLAKNRFKIRGNFSESEFVIADAERRIRSKITPESYYMSIELNLMPVSDLDSLLHVSGEATYVVGLGYKGNYFTPSVVEARHEECGSRTELGDVCERFRRGILAQFFAYCDDYVNLGIADCLYPKLNDLMLDITSRPKTNDSRRLAVDEIDSSLKNHFSDENYETYQSGYPVNIKGILERLRAASFDRKVSEMNKIVIRKTFSKLTLVASNPPIRDVHMALWESLGRPSTNYELGVAHIEHYVNISDCTTMDELCSAVSRMTRANGVFLVSHNKLPNKVLGAGGKKSRVDMLNVLVQLARNRRTRNGVSTSFDIWVFMSVANINPVSTQMRMVNNVFITPGSMYGLFQLRSMRGERNVPNDQKFLSTANLNLLTNNMFDYVSDVIDVLTCPIELAQETYDEVLDRGELSVPVKITRRTDHTRLSEDSVDSYGDDYFIFDHGYDHESEIAVDMPLEAESREGSDIRRDSFESDSDGSQSGLDQSDGWGGNWASDQD